MNLDKQNFNGGYIKASQEAYNLLIADIELHTIYINRQHDGYYYIDNGIARWVATFDELPYNPSLFHINNGKLSWDEPIHTSDIRDLDELPTGDEDMSMLGGGNCRWCGIYKSNSLKLSNHETLCLQEKNNQDKVDKQIKKIFTKETISITDEDGDIATKCGFEYPIYVCEIFFTDKYGVTHGRIDNESIRWNSKGLSFTHPDEYSLTPIQKNWYENEDNFPALIYTSEGFYVAKGKMEASYVFNGTDRLATKQERDSLHCEE